MNQNQTKAAIQDIITRALKEDIGDGDVSKISFATYSRMPATESHPFLLLDVCQVTTLATVGKDVKCTARFLAKQDGVLSGLEVAEMVFHTVSEMQCALAN